MISKFLNPSKVLYNFDKVQTDSSFWTATVIIKEKFRTVIDPNTPSEDKPIKDAIVIVGNNRYTTDENGEWKLQVQFSRKEIITLQECFIRHEFFTYLQPEALLNIFDTSDVMRPVNFTASSENQSHQIRSQLNLINLIHFYLLKMV